MYEESSFEPVPVKKRLSTGAKIGIGCAIAALVGMLVCAGVIYFGVRWGMDQLEQFAKEYEARGYSRVFAQTINVTQPVTQPTVYTGQNIAFRADSTADIAIMGQVADIFSTIDGDLDFFGQMLTIHPGAVITGDVKIKGAQVVVNKGTVHGTISGNYQTMNDQQKREPPAATNTSGDDPAQETDDTTEVDEEPHSDPEEPL